MFAMGCRSLVELAYTLELAVQGSNMLVCKEQLHKFCLIKFRDLVAIALDVTELSSYRFCYYKYVV